MLLILNKNTKLRLMFSPFSKLLINAQHQLKAIYDYKASFASPTFLFSQTSLRLAQIGCHL